MATTLKDIAEASGVSIGTVERALKRKGRINADVAERVRKIAEEMNYRPNKIASGLVNRSKKYRIAVVLHVKGGDFWDEVISGINKAKKEIKDFGVSVNIYYGSSFDPEIQLRNIEKAIADGANALVLVPINAPIIIKKVQELHDQNFPVVFLISYLYNTPCLTSIHCNYYRSGRIAGKVIDSLGSKNDHVIAFISSSKMLGNNRRVQGIREYFLHENKNVVLDDVVELTANPEKDFNITYNVLNANPQVTMVIYNGSGGVYRSVIKKINRPLKTVFFDLSNNTRTALLDGIIDATLVQDPKSQGYRAVDATFQYLTSGIIPRPEILITSQLLFKECID